jgi:hypothetical protein
VAFQANNGYLYTFDFVSGTTNTQQGVMFGTSPSITGLASGGYEEAFQSQSGYLYVWGALVSGDTQLGMMSGASPGMGGR